MSDDESTNKQQSQQPPNTQFFQAQDSNPPTGSNIVQPGSSTHSSSQMDLTNRSSELQSVNAKITMPEFWHQNIRVWFQQVEAQFALFRIQSDITKYNLLLTQLKPNVLTQVASLVENPPENNKYDALKSQIISVFSDSEQRRIKTLLSGLQLGSRKPSHLLNEQRQIAGNLISDQMLKSLWISQLPQHIQAVVVAAPGKLEDLSSIADKIWDMVPESHYASSIVQKQTATTASQPNKQHTATVNKEVPQVNSSSLEAQIAELAMQVKELRASRERARPLNLRRRNSQSRSRQRSDICWYHHRFGAQARKCNPPCKFAKLKTTASENA